MSTPQRGIRARAMEALHPDKALTSVQVAELLSITRQQAIDNLGAAIKDGYIINEAGEDENGIKVRIYSLTQKGRARVANGKLPVGNGKSATENTQACDEREAEAEDRIDTIGQNGNDGLHYDPIARITELESDIRKQRALLEGKNEHIGYLTGQVEKLQADLDEAQRQLMRGATLTNSAQLRRPLAYAHVWADGFELFKDEDVARADIERGFAQNAVGESLLCAVLARADLKLTWSEA